MRLMWIISIMCFIMIKLSFRLLIKACMEQSGVFEGPASTLVFSRDYSLLDKGTYAFVGKLVAWSALLGGPGIFLAKELYVMMIGMRVKKMPIDLVSDPDYKDRIAMVCTEYSLMSTNTCKPSRLTNLFLPFLLLPNKVFICINSYILSKILARHCFKSHRVRPLIF